MVGALLTVRRRQSQRAVCFSNAMGPRLLGQRAGEIRLEVLIKPLHRMQLICEHDDLAADITWTGAFPAVQEQPHLKPAGARPVFDTSRCRTSGAR
ncbi:hypothetical protein [Nocardia asteroides]|uniref:hypothetical protein n=1 Tax=Nocardia asteroides TaxID=1824 RepID=UPI001E291394|nr:hypothetical protein [Nocardia asteroides]UGT63618.1 hypothetical protein LTT61_10030 [Nocardia asteroides]